MTAHLSAKLPRELASGLHWFSTCLPMRSGGKIVHSHNSCFLVTGENYNILIDTGMPHGWSRLKNELLDVLNGRVLDYILPTHPESPHMGNTGPLMELFPDALLVGDLRNYQHYYPAEQHRFRPMKAGEILDLGGRQIEMLPPLIRDLPNTLWAYDTQTRTVFLSDAYPFTHEHEQDQCGLMAEEMPVPPTTEDTRLVVERALSWSRFVDPEAVISEIKELMRAKNVRWLAPAHGGFITDPSGFEDTFFEGLRSTRRFYAAG